MAITRQRLRSELTKRELTVARHIAKGKTNDQIASELELSNKTIKNHLAHIYAKLELRGRVQLALVVLRVEGRRTL